MSDIFISYCRENQNAVRRLAEALESQGWSIFWDRTILPGKKWREHIQENLEKAQCVLVVWSSASVKSQWVIEEAESGLDRDVLMPALFDDVRPPLGFRGVQAARLSEWDGSHESPAFQLLVSSISNILDAPAKRAQAEERQKADEEKPTDGGPNKFQLRALRTQIRDLENCLAQWRKLCEYDEWSFPPNEDETKETSANIERAKALIEMIGGALKRALKQFELNPPKDLWTEERIDRWAKTLSERIAARTYYDSGSASDLRELFEISQQATKVWTQMVCLLENASRESLEQPAGSQPAQLRVCIYALLDLYQRTIVDPPIYHLSRDPEEKLQEQLAKVVAHIANLLE